jgi:hypothetical protein
MKKNRKKFLMNFGNMYLNGFGFGICITAGLSNNQPVQIIGLIIEFSGILSSLIIGICVKEDKEINLFDF